MDSDSILKVIRSIPVAAGFEAVCRKGCTTSIRIEKGTLKEFKSDEDESFGVRCILKGKMSIVNSTINSESDLKELFLSSYKLAKMAGATDSQSEFSRTQSIKSKLKLDYKKSSDDEYLIKELESTNRRISKLKKIQSINSILGYAHKTVSIANSNGITGDFMNDSSDIAADMTAKDGSEQSTGSNFRESINPKELDISGTFDRAAEQAISMLGAKPVKTFRGDLLLSPEAANMLISYFIGGVDGEEILKKRSFLSGKKGREIASKLLHIREEPFVSNSSHNRIFDDELTPTNSKEIIGGGILRTYLHNIYSAEKMNEKSTGNGFLHPDGFIGTTNVVVKPGRGKPADLIRNVSKGIYLISTGDSPNMATGDLSALVSTGYYIENGKIMHPVKETMLGVNMIDFMMNVIAVGEDVLSIGGMSCPSILVKDVKISGAS